MLQSTAECSEGQILPLRIPTALCSTAVWNAHLSVATVSKLAVILSWDRNGEDAERYLPTIHRSKRARDLPTGLRLQCFEFRIAPRR